MLRKRFVTSAFAACVLPTLVSSFTTRIHNAPKLSRTRPVLSEQISVTVEADLTDDKVTALFAWVTRAFAGDKRYNDLMIALVAIFGNVPEDSMPAKMAADALADLPPEEELVGTPYTLDERESASLGAMGAAQWTGQWLTRPHALLDVRNMTSVDEWVKTLPRGCKRTLKRADSQNFTVSAKPIVGGQPAPHSSLAHFRCVVSHEVRLMGDTLEGFFDAMSEGVGRFMGTTRMAGEIREYRDESGRVIAFAHEVRKGRVMRGQWFYATDEASKSYVWFHSVKDLVRRAIETDGVDVVDLGPSGSDAFSELKARYGFVSVSDWPTVADYSGPFYHGDGVADNNGLGSILEQLMRRKAI
uniref:Uncharacterized protein n=1 Tax=Odontella aurita TaxID=265563 RepID=A0A7S4M987_9STRA|mmetsp:Transcript_14644/g.42925  ORF Transcript_14644/g.42925 Transcript_14644/m.42925 type:complete len:358 (+) Transcript_14644:97-1170(+)